MFSTCSIQFTNKLCKVIKISGKNFVQYNAIGLDKNKKRGQFLEILVKVMYIVSGS